MNNPEIEKCMKSLWDYLTVRDKPKAADAMFVFGREDFNIPEKALELYQQGFAPIMILLGGRGRLSGSLSERGVIKGKKRQGGDHGFEQVIFAEKDWVKFFPVPVPNQKSAIKKLVTPQPWRRRIKN